MDDLSSFSFGMTQEDEAIVGSLLEIGLMKNFDPRNGMRMLLGQQVQKRREK